MRKIEYILTILIVLLGCQNQNADKDNNRRVAKSMKMLNQVKGKNKVREINIKDIFLLLPDYVFPNNGISREDREILIDNIGNEKAFEIHPTPIGICDVKNGYLNLTGMQYEWEMCYWNLKDNRKLIAINETTETGSNIKIFLWQNGQLKEDNEYKLGGDIQYKLADFFDISKLPKESKDFAQQQFNKKAYFVFYKLPQKGTWLRLHIDFDNLINDQQYYDAFFEAKKELVIKWENDEWKR